MEGDLAEVGAEGSRLVAALETAWQAIQASNPGVPDAVIVLGTGVERGRLSKLGHWWGGQWVAEGTTRGEVLLAGEALHLKPTDVFEVLLHEAAHGLNTARGIKDVSRGGRYHNAKFKATAIEVGLRVGSMPPYGWAKTELAPATIEHYSAEITRIGEEMRIARRLKRGATVNGTLGGDGSSPGTDADATGEAEVAKKNKPAECGCGRKMRMAPSVLAKGPVMCGVCNTTFELDRVVTTEVDSPSDQSRSGAVNGGEVIDSFLDRRSQQLEGSNAGGTPSDRPSLARSRAALDQAEMVEQLRQRLRTPADAERLVRVARWRGGAGTEPESPMVASDWSDHSRLTQLARTVMELDGSLTKPDGMPPHQPLLVGERVKTAGRIETHLREALPEPDTPGRVLAIDPRSGNLTLDFAAWGRTEISIDDAYEALRWDYATVALPPAEPHEPATEMGVDL